MERKFSKNLSGMKLCIPKPQPLHPKVTTVNSCDSGMQWLWFWNVLQGILMPESQKLNGKRFIENIDLRGLVWWWYWRLPLKGISIIKFHWLYCSYLTLYRGNPYFLHKIIFQVFPKPMPALQPHTCCVVCLYFVFPFSTSYVLLNSFLLHYAYCLI